MAATGSAPANPLMTLDAVALPGRVRLAIEHQLQVVGGDLSRQLRVVQHETELELEREAVRQRATGTHHVPLDAIQRLVRGEARLASTLLQQLENSLASFREPRVSRPLEELAPPTGGLSLVDTVEMDEGAVLGSIAARAESRNSLALQLMGHRYGVLAGAPAFDAEQLPLGPNAVCHALRAAAAAIDLPLEARAVLYRQFEKKIVMAHYPGLLDALNQRLADDGILPHLSFVPVRVRAPAQGAARATPEAPVPGAAAPVPGLPPDTGPGDQDGFSALRDQLARRRLLLAKLRPGGSDERAREALPRDEVLAALRRMRGQQARHGTPSDIRQTLLAQARQAHGRGVVLSDVDNDAFELFGLFLAQLQREQRSGGPAEPLLARLQLPLLQECLRDHAFFVDPLHPARRLLDSVSLAGARWLADDDLDAQALGLLQRAVGSVQQDPDAVPDTFVAANHALQDGLQAAARKADMAERRQVEAANGRERLLLARRRASDEIARHAGGRTVPRFNALLLEQAWTDVLALALLRGGEDGAAWRELRETTATIVEASLAPTGRAPDPALVGRLQEALGLVGYHEEDAAAIANQLANGRSGEDDLSSRTELIVQLKSRARLGEDQVARGEAPALPLAPGADQARARLLAHATEGCWIELPDPRDGAAVRRRLAWASPHTGHVLLLNRRGARVASQETVQSLAGKLARDELRLLDEDLYPAEQAWRAMYANLHRIAGAGTGEIGHGQ